MLTQCLACGSPSLIHDVQVPDQDHSIAPGPLMLRKDGSPKAFLFKDKRTTPILAIVCRDCGYAHFFAANPAKLDITSPESEFDATQAWRCETCGEINSNTFGVCANCQAPNPNPPAPGDRGWL